MTGYQTITKIRRVEEKANALGFKFSTPKYASYDDDLIGLAPLDEESLPLYGRNAEIICGSLRDIEVFLVGAEWARQYDLMLKVSDDKKRERKEQDYRNKQLMQTLKKEDKEEKLDA